MFSTVSVGRLNPVAACVLTPAVLHIFPPDLGDPKV